MASESWKTIDGFNGNYKISNRGRVMSKARGKWKEMSPSHDRYGYLKISLREDGRPKTRSIHQLVATAFVGGRRDELEVNHLNGDKEDNRPTNLEWTTCPENLAHAREHGLNLGPRKKVRVLETGQVYSSEKECAENLGGSISGVNGCLKGRRKTHKGYHYEYVNEGVDE